MLHHRFLDALDSSSPLLFVEAIYGSGTATVLRQWEDRGARRHGEIRLRFDARRLPREPVALARVVWSSLRLRLGQELPELPTEVGTLEAAALQGLRQLRRPVAVAIHQVSGDDTDIFDVLVRLLDAGARLIVAGHDVASLERRARQRGHYCTTLGEREIWLSRAETRELVEEQGIHLGPDALTTLHHSTFGHPGMILTSLSTLSLETAEGLAPEIGCSPPSWLRSRSRTGHRTSPTSWERWCSCRGSPRRRRPRCGAAMEPRIISDGCRAWVWAGWSGTRDCRRGCSAGTSASGR
ncbi:hypothetical protein [Brachybacterium sp.]|uniref:hypothetical protein n=1 Tax=Brachybacterium sp. TaxID=1891286 RepID=UPI003F91F368